MVDVKNFFSGIKKGIPIALGYIPIAITFGILSKTTGVPVHISILMSILVFAGASQFVALNLLALQVNVWEIIFTTFIVNFRHFLMTASVSQRVKKNISKKWLPFIAFGITDETFSLISVSSKKQLPPDFILGVNTVAYLAWVSGTVAGNFLGQNLPEILQTSMGIALYAMFIGLLIPSIKKSKPILIVSLISLGISSFMHWGPAIITSISKGWKIIIITIVSSTIGATLFPQEVLNNE